MNEEMEGYSHVRFDDEDFELMKEALERSYPSPRIKKTIQKIEILLKEPDEEGAYIAVDMEE